MLKWTTGEPVWMRMAVDCGKSAVTSGITGSCVGTHKKPVEGGFSLRMDAALFVVHSELASYMHEARSLLNGYNIISNKI